MTLVKRITKWGAIATAAVAISGALAYAGFNLEKPWPERKAVEEKLQELAGGLTDAIEGQQKLNSKVDRGERRYWVDIEEKAFEDLERDPANRSARRELKRARENIRRLDNQQE